MNDTSAEAPIFTERDEILNDLLSAADRDLQRHRRTTRRRHVTLALASMIMLVATAAVAAPNGPIRNLFAPQVPASTQVPGLSQLGRPLGGHEDDSIREAYDALKGNGNVPDALLPDVENTRVLIDHGDKFKMIAVTIDGKKGGVCIAAAFDVRPVPGHAGQVMPTSIDANCLPRIIYEQPFTSAMQTNDGISYTAFGIVADGVRDIQFITNRRKQQVPIENRAYYWEGRPHEVIREMSARRADGSLYHYKIPQGSYTRSTPPPVMFD